MNLYEVKNALFVKAKINPAFTELAWKKLEGDNPAFFKAYHLRLIVRDQIIKFNRLLERQVELTTQLSAGPTAVHMSNGSHIPPTFNGQAYTGCALQSEYMHQPLGYSNGGSSSVHPCMQAPVDASNNARNINVSSSMLFGSSNMLMGQSSNEGLVQGMNGEIMNLDTFVPNGNVLDARHVAGDMHVSQPINNTLLATGASYEIPGMIPRSSSLSDFTADFFQDILESYPESPFLTTGSDNFLNPQYQVEQQDNRSFDTISKEWNYDDFGGN
ncbi:uncharacterized protein LOC124937040 [Impatiens glandulifera]|uniref:uncharacterized protein LOC124937040 n=1 Tax=Impatiens glandulifera TaxID=253017 RepID=UPI001FB188D1|nr:uncharacterized protein LOC124937040 [Impatiens glandulifera]XP_047333509.1 uncharacterized protein LOC124937040 [Impatiens glandulifera]XP_047333510.1 uncharacterized protein LOC124937040 [Impatiens glandulifera]XP_047333511.1 uncharacterized protein LOC124937040 [Impatiens glandulifera]